MKKLLKERLFEAFLDEVDGVSCVPASSTPLELRTQFSPHGLRFPLLHDGISPLFLQVNSSGFPPASSRFGPYCDNITGMNWRLPDGRMVRVGERVVKSTTGYDILRFLLGSGNRYGNPVDYVLRLRPDTGGGGIFRLEGVPGKLSEAVRTILHSYYLHWLESVDWLEGPEAPSLRVAVHCPNEEWSVFVDFMQGVAFRHGLSVDVQPGQNAVGDGLPDLVFKTTPDRVVSLARELANMGDIRCVALCYCAVVHVYFLGTDNMGARTQTISKSFAPLVEVLGGDWHSRHVVAPLTQIKETAWIAELEREWGEQP
ncbi:MAG: hypothetical protein WCO60_16025 [Verrucomicrobiota bacterium]